jgi:hypothetical protein
VRRSTLSRRQFLQAAGGLAAASLLPPTPPPVATTTEAPEYFVPLADYHELPPDCYEPNLIRPLEIIVHSDGNRRGRDLWVAPVTFETLRYLSQSAHFAVDFKRVWQLLPMYRTLVQEAHGALGFNKTSVHIEMAGLDFDLPDNYPPESEIYNTVQLASQLMDYYRIAFAHVVGHYERDPRGLKTDPGRRFMEDFRLRLTRYRAGLSPLKAALLDPA